MTTENTTPGTLAEADAAVDDGRATRRRLLRRGGLLAAGAAVATVALGKETAQPAAAATGDPVLLGDWTLPARNLAEAPTTLRYDGPPSPGTVFLVEDTEYLPTDTGFPAAIAGWVGGTVPGLTTGVYGWTAVNGGGVGVVGRSAGTDLAGIGVYGDAADRNGIGVKGASNTGGTGVRGDSLGDTLGTAGTGVYGRSITGNGVIGETARSGGTDDGTAGVVGFSTGISGVGVLGSANSGGGAVGVWGRSLTGLAGLFSGKVQVIGDFTVVGGFKSAAVRHPDGSHRRLYCVESPENWFEDFGTGTLVGGVGRVPLDPDFATLVHTEDYHVFLTPRGDSQGLYVSSQTPAGFEVREQRGGSSSLSFSYRLVAKRGDVAAPRLPRVTVPDAAVAPAAIETAAAGRTTKRTPAPARGR
jgi:hypothetical protein